MDTSKEYIKMCQKATEIQDIWIPEMYDKYGSIGGDIGWTLKHTDLYSHEKRKMVWLPRQDQLQNMLLPESSDSVSISALLESFNHYVGWNIDESDYLSMEQLWLCYVVHEKYKKEWNGLRWV